jgi:acetyl esterase/lipase
VYRRRGQPADGPVLIHFHGGHFRGGRKSWEARPLLHRLARQGWICVSANYRLRQEGRFPNSLVDAKRVVAWARENAAGYGADPGAIVVAGSSAGAHLASMAALTPNDPTFQPGFEDADTSVAAAVCLYGYYGPRDASGAVPSSPVAYVDASAPPFFLAHGDHDTIVPVDQARAFAETLRAHSTNPVVYAELPGAQHGFDLFHSLRCEAVVDGIEAFSAWLRSRDVPGGDARR